jgi:guanine nucleotide-binding protein subunit beta-2-like 1 protein
MAEQRKPEHSLKYKGYLKGHGGWVTTLAVGDEEVDGQRQEFLMSGSRDKTMIKWELDYKKDEDEDREWGKPKRLYTGHSHFVSEICLTGDSRFAFSASWDGTVRLWNVANAKTISKLIGHQKEVLSVALSVDDRQIITGGMDTAIKIWNTRSECKHTVDKDQHTDAVSCVRFYHAQKPAICVTASWDKTIKVWDNLYMNLMHTFTGHKAQINTLDMVHGSSYLASGSRDGTFMLWDLVKGKWLTSMDCDSPVNCVLFSQKLYWLIIGTESGIRVLDLPSSKILQDITETSMKPNEQNSKKALGCTSLAWDKNGTHLFAGWTDNYIRVYKLEEIVNAKEEAAE